MPDSVDVKQQSLTQVIMGVQSGNPKSQEELYNRFKPMIYKMTRSIDKNNREDAQQELACELILAARRFNPERNIETQ